MMAFKQMLTRISIGGGCLLGSALLHAQAPQFTIQDLGALPDLPACAATAVSQSGNVTGYCQGHDGVSLAYNPAIHSFLYSKGVMKDLNANVEPTAVATAVNDSGTVVGAYLDIDLLNATAGSALFIYQNGSIQPQPQGVVQGLLPFGLNNAGQFVGTNFQINAGSFDFFIHSQAVQGNLSGGAPVILSAPAGGGAAGFGLNSKGTVAGASVEQNAAQVMPLLWQNGTPQPLPLLSGYPQAAATSVNDSGVAAGIAFDINFSVLQDLNAKSHAVVFDNGSVTDLGVISGDRSSMALGINNSGWVVGFSSRQPPDFTLQLAAIVNPPGSNFHAFVYADGKMYDLNRQLVNGSGWQLSFATQVNDAGQIVGTGLRTDSDGVTHQRGFLLTPLTGPNIGSIVGAGLSTPSVTSISPNGLFTIYGNQLASVTQGITSSDILDNQLPTNLGGTCVESGGTKWGLFFVSPAQINALAGTLPSSGTVPVSVVTNCGSAGEVVSPPVDVPVAPLAPEFLYFLETSSGQNPVATIQAVSGAYVGSPGLISGATFTPAKAGDVLTAFGVGWGGTTPSDPIGTIASAASTLPGPYSLTLGNMPVEVSYAGLSPGFAGLYQINFTVPSGLSAGNQPLVLTVNGTSTSSKAYITIGD
jgi:uncharacterized protein (TIGR03437 family)